MRAIKVTHRRGRRLLRSAPYALAHNLGFAAVSGAAVRYRLYSHWGLTPFEIAKVVAFCSLTFGLGGMVLGGIILFWEPDAVPFFGAIVPRWGMYAIGLALWGVVAAYVSLSRFVGTIRLFGGSVTLPDYRMAVVQVALATVDVAVTAAIFYQLLPDAPGLTYLRFLGVYVASYTAGLAANLPADSACSTPPCCWGWNPTCSRPPSWAPSSCSGSTTTSSPCSWPAACSQATRSCCAAAPW